MAVDQALVRDALLELQRKKNLDALSRLRFESFAEGLFAQTSHVGPFSAEGPTFERVHAVIAADGRKLPASITRST